MLTNAPSEVSRACMLIAVPSLAAAKPRLQGWFKDRPALSMKAPEKSGAFSISLDQ